jgi:hypothetical protein
MLRDLRGPFAASDRDGPLPPGCNCTLVLPLMRLFRIIGPGLLFRTHVRLWLPG